MDPDTNHINPVLSSEDFSRWIKSTRATMKDLAFGPLPFENISRHELIEQLEGFRKSKEKLPTWHKSHNLIYPPKISIEQCSSEQTAEYKANLLKRHYGSSLENKTIADLTGGFGVDAYFMACAGAKVHHFEINKRLSAIVNHNMKQLNAKVQCHPQDGIHGINHHQVDVIYLDPARRDLQQKKVFRLEDCQPNVLGHLDSWLNQAEMVMIKTSPMLDLSLGIDQLKTAIEIHVVAVDNEVKELIWCLTKKIANTPQGLSDPEIYVVNMKNNSAKIDHFPWALTERQVFGPIENYLFEPHAAWRKVGRYSALLDRLSMRRIGPNAHLFSADQPLDFPGRSFRIMEKFKFTKGVMKQFKNKQFNVTTRDFPMRVSEIRNMWRIMEGGDQYLFFTTDHEGQKWIILTEKYPKIQN